MREKKNEEILLGLDVGILLEEILPGGEQLLRGHAQVVRQESDHAASFHIGQFTTKNQLLDQQGGRVGAGDGQDFSEQIPTSFEM